MRRRRVAVTPVRDEGGRAWHCEGFIRYLGRRLPVAGEVFKENGIWGENRDFLMKCCIGRREGDKGTGGEGGSQTADG